MYSKLHSRTATALIAGLCLQMFPAFGQDAMGLQVTATSSQLNPTTLSLKKLDQMDQTVFETTTIWTDGKVAFSGVPLKTLLVEMGAKGRAVEMVALNDYSVTMPIDALEDTAPIVATRMNGKAISVRDKGPFWVVFPYDSHPKYQTETVYARSIWQLNRLQVVD